MAPDHVAAVSPARSALPPPRLAAVMLSLFFVVGFSAVFIALGASASAIGQLLMRYLYEANIAGCIVVIIFGLVILGLSFGFGWTPCIGPVLGAILTVSAAQGPVSGGVVQLSVYALGLGVPFLLAAVFTGEIAGKLKSLRRFGRGLTIAAGAIMILMRLAMATGRLTRFGLWLLKTFPALGRIG